MRWRYSCYLLFELGHKICNCNLLNVLFLDKGTTYTICGFSCCIVMSGIIEKIRMGEDVLSASMHRIEWVFDTFSSVCLSFSGGKDSTVLFHLVAEVARKKNVIFLYCSLIGKRSISALSSIFRLCG